MRSETRKGQEQPLLDPVRKDAQNLSVQEITGLSTALQDLPTRQLMLPLAICHPQSDSPLQGA